jgi:hypothetical protein
LSDERLRLAVEDNVAHCDRVVREDGVPTFQDDDRWWATARTRELYPDAITRRPGLTAEQLLAGLEPGPGCSVKDSFADVDLVAAGFEVLFEARWLWLPGEPEGFDYERGEALEAAKDAGAVELGPLRVWVTPG